MGTTASAGAMSPREFNQEKYNQFIKDHKVVGLFAEPVRLKSGRLSSFYVNWRTAAEDVFLTEQLARTVIDYVVGKGLHPDTFYGVPEGATKLATITQYLWASQQSDYGEGSHALSMGRGKEKDYGMPKDRSFLGIPRGGAIVVEDTTTTGGSLITEIRKLREAGVNVVAAVCLTNRNEKTKDGKSVEDALIELGVPLFSMSNALELLPVLIATEKTDQKIVTSLINEFNEFGVRPLILNVKRHA